MVHLQLLARETELLTLLLILCNLFLPATFGLHCYKKCSCTRNTYFKKHTLCIGKLKYLDIYIDKSGIGISCGNISHLFGSDIVSFDASYLTSINSNSSLTTDEMIRKCLKTKYRHINYSMDIGKIQRITLSNNLLITHPNITHLNIKSIFINKRNILNMERSFLGNVKKLESLRLTHFDSVIIDDLKQLAPTLENIDLSSNNLSEINDHIFNANKNLKVVNLSNNKLLNVTRSKMANLKNITYLDLSENRINTIDKYAFLDFFKLRYLNISFNNLQNIHYETFLNKGPLETLDLSNNKNITLPKYIFKSLHHLKSLNLSECNLKDIPTDLFEDTLNLQRLNISRNTLTSIENQTFGKLKNMSTLDLSFNKLQFLPDDIFINLTSIKEIYINDNKFIRLNLQLFLAARFLDIIDASTNNIEEIEGSPIRLKGNELILRDNRIRTFSEVLYINLMMSKIDLSNNYIQKVILNRAIVPDNSNLSINLSENQIKYIDIEGTASMGKNWSIYLDAKNNYIQCSCALFSVGLVDNKSLTDAVLRIDSTQTTCISQGQKCIIFKIRNCPFECNCIYMKNETSIVVDCSSRNLRIYPVLPKLEIDNKQYKYNKIILLLNNNHLNLAKQEYLDSYEDVSVLDLSNNEITDIKWIPPNIVELNLMDNYLETLNEKVIESLRLNRNLHKVYLENNYWVCDERARHLQSFLIDFNNIVVNQSAVICNKTGEYLIYTNLYPQHNNVTKMVLLISITVFLALLSALMMVYYLYGNAIKIYLYSKNICLWCVAEEELDKDKEYDIFISYSHKDESFVQNELLKELECGDTSFKVCIHYRNWLPGEFISKQIIDSVLNSRRTLVILSNNFMESVWGKMEFRTAHTQAINEGRARVIVILYGDLDEDSLDDEMKTYLKTNTYVKWGDPWFWNKLKYALPHSKAKSPSKPS